jgi:NADH:ubiquinone oxidoreductase subunit K
MDVLTNTHYLMYIGDINLFSVLFFLMLTTIIINVNTALHLLLTAEILWITLYLLSLSIGFLYDNVNFLSLTFFFLVLSAVEFGIGLVIILIQNIFLRSISLTTNSDNFFKNSTRFSSRIKSGKVNWLN